MFRESPIAVPNLTGAFIQLFWVLLPPLFEFNVELKPTLVNSWANFAMFLGFYIVDSRKLLIALRFFIVSYFMCTLKSKSSFFGLEPGFAVIERLLIYMIDIREIKI